MARPPDSLPDDARALKELLIAARDENERLIAIIKVLQRHRFGPRSEKIDPDQSRRVAQTFASRGGRRRSRRQVPPRLQQASGQARRGRLGTARHDPGALQGHRHAPAQIRLPRLRRRGDAGSGARTSDRGRHSDRGASTSVPPRIWPASLDASRSMATAPTKRWPRATRLRWLSAGRTRGETSSTFRPRTRPRSPSRR